MSALSILALVLVIPVLLIPVAFVWYINIAGLRYKSRMPVKAPKWLKEHR